MSRKSPGSAYAELEHVAMPGQREEGEVRAKGIHRRPQKKKARRQSRSRRRHADRALAVVFRFTGKLLHRISLVILLGVFVIFAALYYYGRGLPSVEHVQLSTNKPQISILASNGVLLTRYGDIVGKPVDVLELPDHVIHAFLATEDRNFYHHKGVNPLSVVRALLVNLRSGKIRQGGSTITQQLAKNKFLTSEKTIRRKAQEALLALQLELAYSKDEILSLYLSNVYFGAGTYGLSAAADQYFNKVPNELTIGEAAMLAGLLKAPSRYSPASHPEAAQARARIVLQSMAAAGYITQRKADELKAGGIATIVLKPNFAPYATDHILSRVADIVGDYQGNLVIHSTIDLDAMRTTSAAIAGYAADQQRLSDDTQIGLISVENSGAIRVLIGGRDYQKSEFNRVTSAKRQPGSAFKPFVYLAAIEAGWQPDDLILDEPFEVDDWAPANYKNKFYGLVEIQEAMARSLNSGTVRLQEAVGRQAVLELAERMGFGDQLDPGAALALGVNEITPIDLAAAYLPFVKSGHAGEPYIIETIYDDEGQEIYRREEGQFLPLVERDHVIAINHMFRRVVQMGSGRAAALPGYQAAGKTGTTQDSRDAWFAGHAAGVVGIVWMGKDDYSPMMEGALPVSGSGTPALLWKDLMLATLKDRPDREVVPWESQRSIQILVEALEEEGAFDQDLLLSEDLGESPKAYETMEDLLSTVSGSISGGEDDEAPVLETAALYSAGAEDEVVARPTP